MNKMFLLSGILAFLLALVLIPIFKNLAVKTNLCDNPRDDVLKIHKRPIPLIGGVGMLLTTSIALGVMPVFVKINHWQLLGILTSGLLAAGLGLWDDLRWKNKSQDYKPKVKFTLQILVSSLIGIILFFAKFQIQFIPISIFAILLAIFYIFGGMNAINMQDGIDGLMFGEFCYH